MKLLCSKKVQHLILMRYNIVLCVHVNILPTFWLLFTKTISMTIFSLLILKIHKVPTMYRTLSDYFTINAVLDLNDIFLVRDTCSRVLKAEDC